MKRKYLGTKRMAVSALIITVSLQLVGCGNSASKELNKLTTSGETIEIVIDGTVASETERLGDWAPLATLTDQESLRTVVDDKLMIISFGEGSKNGVLYVNPETEEWEPNNTLSNVYKNKAFLEYWNNVDNQEAIGEATMGVYVDLDESTSTEEVRMATINGYFNIFKDDEENGLFNGNSTLTRAEFMTGLARASEKAQDIVEASSIMKTELGDSENTAYAHYVAENSYLDLESGSLNEKTYNGTMTRAEAVYMICSKYYSEELNKTTEELEGTGKYSDCLNAGNMAEKAGTVGKEQYRSANLYYMVENPDNGLDEELYKAMLIAYNHGLLGDVRESRWDEAITKVEALKLLTNTYLDLGTTCNCNLGNYDAEEFISKEESHDLPVYTKEELIAELGITDETHFTDDAYQYYMDMINSPLYKTHEQAFNEEVNVISDGAFLRPEVADELVEQSSSNKGSSSSAGNNNTGSTETAGNTSNTGSNTNNSTGFESPDSSTELDLSGESLHNSTWNSDGFSIDDYTSHDYTEEELRILETLH